jgi:hypothetical protein
MSAKIELSLFHLFHAFLGRIWDDDDAKMNKKCCSGLGCTNHYVQDDGESRKIYVDFYDSAGLLKLDAVFDLVFKIIN